jgi:inner membrane protein
MVAASESSDYHPRAVDTVTHGIAGAVFARALAARPGARAALLFGLVAAMLPDLDFLFLTDRLDYLRNHRGWTHSFVYLPLFALGLALAAKVVFRHTPLVRLWLFSAVGLATHILFDWITSFGTMFWIPFRRTRYSLDWVFILDPIFTGIVALSLLAAGILRAHGRRIAAAGGATLLLYLGFCAALHARALSTWKRLDVPPPGAPVVALPQFLSPFRWLGLSEHDGELHAAFFDIGPFAKGVEKPAPPTRLTEVLASLSDFYPPPERARIRRYPKPSDSPSLAAARALPEVRTYLDFARFPLAALAREPDGGTSITFQDLRFLPWFTGPWEREKGGRYRRQPFVYRVRLDRSGRPIEKGFVR